jgi:hypothetical protein
MQIVMEETVNSNVSMYIESVTNPIVLYCTKGTKYRRLVSRRCRTTIDCPFSPFLALSYYVHAVSVRIKETVAVSER